MTSVGEQGLPQMDETGHGRRGEVGSKTYERALIFLLLRLRRRTRFFLHLALILTSQLEVVVSGTCSDDVAQGVRGMAASRGRSEGKKNEQLKRIWFKKAGRCTEDEKTFDEMLDTKLGSTCTKTLPFI